MISAKDGVLRSAAAGLLSLGLALGATADDAASEGLAIALEADRRDQGFADTASTLTMTLRSKRGFSSTRRLRSRILEKENDGNKSLIIFDDPKDVRGTALLSFTHKQGPDDQWLYLPALKRVKRIASSNQSGPFMGSEFAYEDMGSQEVEKYDYRLLGEDTFDDREHFVLERTPRDRKSGYTRQVVWLDKMAYRTWKIDYFDRKGALLKTLTATGYQQYLAKHWRPNRMDMVNHQTGKTTTLEWTGYTFGNGFTDRDFDRNRLAQAR